MHDLVHRCTVHIIICLLNGKKFVVEKPLPLSGSLPFRTTERYVNIILSPSNNIFHLYIFILFKNNLINNLIILFFRICILMPLPLLPHFHAFHWPQAVDWARVTGRRLAYRRILRHTVPSHSLPYSNTAYRNCTMSKHVSSNFSFVFFL